MQIEISLFQANIWLYLFKEDLFLHFYQKIDKEEGSKYSMDNRNKEKYNIPDMKLGVLMEETITIANSGLF